MGKAKELQREIESLKNQLSVLRDEKQAQEAKQSQDFAVLQKKVLELEDTLSQREIHLKAQETELAQMENLKKQISRYEDSGFLTMQGFKLIPPLLNEVLGRPFLITLAEEFEYDKASDYSTLNQRLEEIKRTENNFHCFRDEIKPGCSFRVVYTFTSKEYILKTPGGEVSFHDLMFPKNLNSGVEITSQYGSALYLCLKNNKIQSAVLPGAIYGAPLLSYAFPIHDKTGKRVGAVSFSNDISQIVNIAKSLGNIVSSNSDEVLNRLAKVLKEELKISQDAALELKDESVSAKKIAETIRRKGREAIEIAERLKVLALNTAIEATKVGKNGKGVGVISEQMRSISESTRKSLQEIYKFSQQLYDSSSKVFDTSTSLENSSGHLREESAILFDASIKITTQKDDLAALVRMSIDEIAQNQDDLNKIFMLLK